MVTFKPAAILLIVIDSLRADRMSCYGYRLKTTPFLDSILDDFVKFKWAFSSCSYTVPSITSILTGLYPRNHSIGLYHTNFIYSHKLNNEKDILLSEYLQQAGYNNTCIFGAPVLHGGLGITKGFNNVYEENRYRRPYYETTRIVCDIIKNSQQPFFEFIHYFDVHYTYEYGYKNNAFSLDNYLCRYRGIGNGFKPHIIPYVASINDLRDVRIYEASYDSSILLLDNEIKKIINVLKSKNLYDNTMIVITADHGELIEEDSILFDHGVNLNPALIRVPLLLKFPKYLNFRSIVSDRVVSNVSITPTILNVCGISTTDKKFDGINLIENDLSYSNTPVCASTQLLNASIFDMKDKIKVLVTPLKLGNGFPTKFRHSGIYIIDKLSGKTYYRKQDNIIYSSIQKSYYNKCDIIVPLWFVYIHPIIMFLFRIIIYGKRVKSYIYKGIIYLLRILKIMLLD